MTTADDSADTLIQIGKLLGVADPTDPEVVRKAFDALYAPVAVASRKALATMSKSEIAMCRAKGISAAKYCAHRNATRAVSPAGSYAARMRRQ